MKITSLSVHKTSLLAAANVSSDTLAASSVYEHQFAALFPQGLRTFAFWKGRVALHAILESLGVGPGDEVIVPGFTCVVVPNAVIYRGATPVYVDIEGVSFGMSVEDLKSKITNRTKAIIVQHSYGIPTDMDPIMSLARERKIAVLEDCAHALGSTYKGRIVGSIANAAFFSFQWSKPYTTGMGGMAVVSDPCIGERLASVQSRYAKPGFREVNVLRLQAMIHKKLFTPGLFWVAMNALQTLSKMGLFIASSSKEELVGDKPAGYEKRMSDFQASLGMQQLSVLKDNFATRERLAGCYRQMLADAGFEQWTVPSETRPVLVRYPLLVKDKQAVLAEAQRRNIEVGSWFDSVIHPSGSPLENLGYLPGQCPVAERVVRQVVNLPLHARVSEKNAARTIDFIKEMREHGYA